MSPVPIADLSARLHDRADPRAKAWWENYVKGSAPFIGVKMPVIRALVREWHRGVAALAAAAQVDLALDLVRARHTEEKLAGALLLQKILLPAGAVQWRRDVDRFAALFADGHVYDWNTCDWFCVKVLGPLIAQEGLPCARRIAAWSRAPALWQARAGLVAFVPVADDPAYDGLTAKSCAALIRRGERFAKTAVGWVLRDISKRDGDFADRVVRRHLADFSLESLRNATKHFDSTARDALIKERKSLTA